MALDISTKVCREASQDCFFINTSSCKPLVLNKSSDALSEKLWELPVFHPFFCVTSLEPPLFKPHSNRLQIGLRWVEHDIRHITFQKDWNVSMSIAYMETCSWQDNWETMHILKIWKFKLPACCRLSEQTKPDLR